MHVAQLADFPEDVVKEARQMTKAYESLDTSMASDGKGQKRKRDGDDAPVPSEEDAKFLRTFCRDLRRNPSIQCQEQKGIRLFNSC